jgi:hypothetical protein
MVFPNYPWFFPNLPMVLNFPFIPRITWGNYFYFGNHFYMGKLLLHGKLFLLGEITFYTKD